MTRLPREPLDADERALAARLPRLHGRDEPDGALDARVLAAAHAALSPMPVPRRRRRGWIVPLTAAASVSLAVGLAWQLQPPPAPTMAPAGAPVAAAIKANDAGQAVVQATEAAPMREQAAEPKSMPSPAIQAAPAGDVAQIAREAPPSEPTPDLDTAAPTFVPAPPPAPVEDALPSASAPPPPAPPPPPLPPPPAVRAQAAMARSASTGAGENASGTAQAQAQATRTRQNEAEAAAEALTSEQFAKALDEEDVPPATMDAPAARDAWLRRIGELQQQGRIEDAKASLAEFRRRYPDAVLPPELRKLEP